MEHRVVVELLFLSLFVHLSTQDTHSLQYLHTSFSSRTDGPEFTAAIWVDGEEVVYYDSNISKAIPKTEWIKKVRADDPAYWNRETQKQQDEQHILKFNLKAVMQSFNQNKGDHTLQRMYSCECGDNGTPTERHMQYCYDEEDFLSLNLITGNWTAVKPEAESFIKMLESTGRGATHWKSYIDNECIVWLKKFVSCGGKNLKRKVRPKVSVFQKHSSPSPEVVCNATGFFPKPLNITWQKDGEDVHEDVELRETLPNQDGSFQKRSILKVPAEELQKHTYTCVVQHSSLKKELAREVPKGPNKLEL
ncbi:BOLA class I histocompatibility antigen, alpha chain BL3-7-like [Clarias gariepinus]|uniref:BOLA class I histocompatibility antigen, alpha chain BL3-7-like n=1 Tax=Clarias gariepinus TaxID=13013 RepID=UPI00234D5300|nr:BOLA class I histocompatibility antigen, alpha chain BL3-7-like [Clarias gariepinus]